MKAGWRKAVNLKFKCLENENLQAGLVKTMLNIIEKMRE